MTARPQLVERDGEIRALLAGWSRAVQGTGSAWLVRSEGGGGKTSLIREFLMQCGAPFGMGYSAPVAPPEPFVALKSAIPGFSAAGSLTDAVERALGLLREQGTPRIVVLDDLHYADEGTIGVALRLALLAGDEGWMLVLSFRPGEASSLLEEATTEMVAQRQATAIDLAPLSADGVTLLIESVTGERADPADVRRIAADSGGNPWLVEALARGSGALSAARDRLQVRLGRIERELPGAFSVLSALSPATIPIPFAAVAAACGGDTPELRAILTGLIARRILEETGDAWHYRQELMRKSVLESLIPADRRDAHRALGEALEAYGPAAALAMHYAAAGDARAANWAIRAGEEAAGASAHREAYAQFQRALAFPLEPSERLATIRLAATEASLLGRFDDCMRLAAEGAAAPEAEPDERLALLHLAAMSSEWEGDAKTADDCWSEGHELALSISGTIGSASFLTWRVLFLVLSDDREELTDAIATARRDLALLRPGRLQSGLGAVCDAAELLAGVREGDTHASVAIDESIHATSPVLGPEQLAMLNGIKQTVAVQGLLLDLSERTREAALEAMGQFRVGWGAALDATHVLELVYRGEFAESLSVERQMGRVAPGSPWAGALMEARVLRDARCGSPARALATIADAETSGPSAALVGCKLEVLGLIDPREAATLAAGKYERLIELRALRPAGLAAVTLARSGAATLRPSWLSEDSPASLYWAWADALCTGEDSGTLRQVAGAFEAKGLPYDAALVLRDAGDLQGSYRRLAVMGARTMQEILADELRRNRQPVPRRTRARMAADGLTDTERAVCRLVSSGARSREVAEKLGVSVRTIETHLTNIYQKTGLSGRMALTQWWREHLVGNAPPI